MAVLVVAGCADSRGLNWFEAQCVDRVGIGKGAAGFDRCVQDQRQAFEDEYRRLNRPTGGGAN
jgi:hypothetical protein